MEVASPVRLRDGSRPAPVLPAVWSAWIGWTILALVLVDTAWIALTQVSIAPQGWPVLARTALFVPLGLLVARRLAAMPNLQSVAIGASIMLAAWPALRLLNHLTMTTALPWADPWLAGMDARIGFDWLGYLHWVDAHPWLVEAMGRTYKGLDLYAAFLFLLIAIGPDPAPRCAEFVKLFLVIAILCIVLGMMFPARAAGLHYAPPPGTFAHFAGDVGSYHIAAMEMLRGDPAPVLDPSRLPGLVTFPSFHTAVGVLAIWCCRHSRPLLAFSIVLNLTMIASTPVFGSHYGIDVIAGAGVALAVIAAMPAARARPASSQALLRRADWRPRSVAA